MGERQIITVPLYDMKGIYIISEKGRVTFSLFPDDSETLFLEKITDDPLVQISCTGDSSGLGFNAGQTRHNSGFTMSLKYVSQAIEDNDEEKVVTTTLKSENGLIVKHVVISQNNCRGIRVYSEISNEADEPVTIEALSSINISGLTPYVENEGRYRLLLHRFRSRWSEEGRHEVNTIEDLLLEPSWSEFGARCEKFGAIGSMPVRGFFPFSAVEDKVAGVVWAISLACSSSWQIEAYRSDKNLSLAGGLADFEFGHWRKIIAKGESFKTPEAYVTAVKGDFNIACDRLLDVQRSKLLDTQRVDKLPAIFNEYCTTWGEPSEKRISDILSVINGKDFGYFVIDAGWYADSIKGWQDNMGDWVVAKDLFPNGIKAVVDKINAAGMKAGIWFELEVVGEKADAVYDVAHLLTRDGKVIISGTRRFWDMRNSWVVEMLTTKVINFLKDNGFKYIKIDYNDTIGIGCDGAESYGEGLRQSVEATKAFYRKIRENIPDIAIEVCSSGGHRLEPGFMELADYLSFSDAHEEKEIPVIAADVQSLVLTQKSQIWAVLRKEDELKRIAYSVCAGMYGVLCISGDVEKLSKEQWNLALEGVSFYKKVSPVIINGYTKRFGKFQKSNRQLEEYQATVRYGKDKILVIVHSFEQKSTQIIQLPIEGDYRISDIFETGNHKISLQEKKLQLTFEEAFDAVAILLEKC